MSEENIETAEQKDLLRVCDRLRHFAALPERKTLSKVCVKAGCAYASDGRIAVRWQFAKPEDVEDDVPDGFPLEIMTRIFAKSWSDESWHRIEMPYYREAEKTFLEEFRKARAEIERVDRDRYKKVVCPCCNEDLYWDTFYEKLVKEDEMEVASPMKPIDHQFPVVLVFGEGFEKKMLVDFGYLLTIFMALGDDILFGMQHVKNVDTPNLLFRSKDGSIEGVLMPLRVVDDSDLKGKHEIVMVRT